MKKGFPCRKPFNTKKIFPVTMTDSLLLMQLVIEEEIEKKLDDAVDPEDEDDEDLDDDEDEDKDDEDDDDEEDDSDEMVS